MSMTSWLRSVMNLKYRCGFVITLKALNLANIKPGHKRQVNNTIMFTKIQ